jgi:carbamoyl-phosphate synthase large subunit
MTERKRYAILVTTSGSVTAQGVLKGLRKQKEFECKIITTDITSDTPGKYIADAFYQLPNEQTPDYIPKLLEICKNEHVDVLIPIHDNELIKISQNLEKFERISCKVVASNYETIEVCNDKYKTYSLFKKIGIATPDTYRAEEVLSGQKEIVFPAFLKPARGVSAIDTYTVDSPESLRVLAKTISEPLVQTLVKGREYSVDILCDLNGQVIEIVPRSRDARNQGACIKGVTEKNEAIMEGARRIAMALGLRGPANIQCFKKDSGEIIFFEVNPRFSATHAHTIMAGLNTPHLLLKMIDGQNVEPRIGQFKDKLHMYRHWSEIYLDDNGAMILGDRLY